MDYDDNDFQNQNLHLAGEANNKFPPVLQPYALPKFDFDDTLNTHLRFDSLVETEDFLSIEGNEDSSWIEDFSRGDSGIVFSSGATESCAISRHNNVWSEATSSESVEMLLNSVGQDEVIVREDTTKKSGNSDELGCTMEQLEPGQTNHENILPKEETANVQPNTSVDDTTPGDYSVLKTDAEQEQVLVKDDSPTVAEKSSTEEINAILASKTVTVEAVDTVGHDKIGTETTDSLLDQTLGEASSMEENNAVLASNTATVEAGDTAGHDAIGTERTDSLLDQIVAEEPSMEENNAVLASNAVTVEAVDTAGEDKIATETTDSLLDQTVAEESSMEENNAILASNAVIVEAVDTAGEDKIETETTDSRLDQTVAEESSMEENNAILASNAVTVEAVDTTGEDKIETETTDSLLDQTVTEASSMEEKNAVLASNTATVDAVDTAGHDKLGTETTGSLLDQTEDEANAESKMEIDDGTVPTGVPCSGELNYQTILLPETSNDENDISNQIKSSHNGDDLTIESRSVLVEAHCDSRIDTTSVVANVEGENFDETEKSDLMEMELSDVTVLERGEQALSTLEVSGQDVSGTQVANVEAENFGETEKPDLKEMELSDVTLLERGDQALSTFEVGGQDVSNIQCQEFLVSSAHTSATVEASVELAEEFTTLTSNVSMEKPESRIHQHMEVTESEHECTFVTETHTQILLVETSESVSVSQTNSMVESTKGDVSRKGDNNEGIARMSNIKQSLELAVNANDRHQDARSSQIISESVVSESVVGYVPGDAASKLVESKSQFDTTPADNSGTMIDGKECEVFPLISEESHQLRQDGAPVVYLTSSTYLHTVNTSSDVNDQGSFSETEKVTSVEPENDQTVPPVDASSSGSHIDQQARKHTEDTQQSTEFVVGCPASEGSKDAVDADAAGQVLHQQSEETILEENIVTEAVDVLSFASSSETRSILDKDGINEKPNTSSLAIRGSEAGEDGREEDNTAASGGIMAAGSPVSHSTGDVIGKGDSRASTSSEPFAKSHMTGTENAATNLGTPLISFPAGKTSELQLHKTETNSVKKPEDQSISSFMSVESPVLNRNVTFSSGLNSTSDPRKAGEISKAVNFSQAALVSPIVVGSPSTSSLEKTAAKSSKTKPERKPRRTPKSAGKETSRKGNSVKGAAPFQHIQSGGKTNAVNQTAACSIQITSSTEKQQSLQTPALNAFGTLSAPAASLPDLNSSALSSILRRPFTDLQQVQLRAQIFVYGALIQGTAPDEAYMISAFGGQDGGKGSWEKSWRACVVRAQKLHVSTPETPLQSRTGKTEIPSAGHTISKGSATKPIIPLSSPLWSLSTSLDTLQSSSIQRGSAAAHQPLLSTSHSHQTPPSTNIVGHNTPWMSPLPYRNPWLASPQTSGFDVGSRFPVFPITEPVKFTPTKESSLPYSGAKHVLSGTSSNVFKGTPTLEPASTVVAPGQHSTGTKSRKRKKMPVSEESGPNILNSLKQTELVVSPLDSISTPVSTTAALGNMTSNAGTLPNVSFTPVTNNLVSTFPGKKTKSSLPSPIFGGNLIPEVQQRSFLSVDTIDKLNEATMHAEDASALAAAAVSHSEYVWKQIEQQMHAGLQPETEGRLASAAVAIAAAAAVAKAAAAAANVAANAALQAKLMAEEASVPSSSDQGNELPKSSDMRIQGQGTHASILKGEKSAVMSSSSVLSAAREAAKKRVEAATAATKRAENMDSIVKAAELASEAVSQAGILVSMGHPPLLNKLVEAGPSNYWRQAQESEEVQPCETGGLEKETVATSDRTFASPRTVPTELDAGSVRTADGVSGPVSTIGKKTKGQKGHKGADLAKNNAVVFEPEFGSKSSIDTQTESEQIMKTANYEDIKEGSHVEVFKEGPELRTAWYSANVLSLEDEKAYVVFNDLSVEEGTDKLKEWVALKGEGDEAPKIRTARSVTAMPYEGTRKRRRAAIGDPVWKIGDRVDSWVHDSWLEGVITEKNKKDENTVTVHFPAQGDTLTIKAWNLRPSLVWKDGMWIECSTSGENISSSHEGDTPKEKRPRLGAPALVAKEKDTTMKIVDVPDFGKPPPPQSGVLDLGVSENTFNIGRSTREEGKPDPLRMKRSGLQTQGSKSIFGVPKPGKKRKFMDVSKHYVSEASTKTRERREPVKPVKPVVPQSSGPGSWRLPSKTVSREKQTTTVSRPKTFKPAPPKTKENPGAAARIIPRKDSRNTTSSNMESDNAVDQSGENKDPASGTTTNVPSKGTGEEQTTSSSQDNGSKNTSSSSTNKGKVAPTAGRLAKIEEDKALAENSSRASDGMEPRRSVRRIQPTSRLLEGLQTSMMTSKIPSMSHNKSHQSQSKK